MYIARVNDNRREAVSVEVVFPVITVMRKVIPFGKRLKRLNQRCAVVGKDVQKVTEFAVRALRCIP